MNSRNINTVFFSTFFVLMPPLFSATTFAQDNTVEFDTSILKSRGLDSSLGAYFADSAKFLPGRKPVDLHINGNDKGNVTARFGQNGELCVDRDFLQSAGLNVPRELNKETPTEGHQTENESCFDYRKSYPTAVITPIPGEERLDIVVPEDALSQAEVAMTQFNQGGTAGLFNYDLFTTRNTSRGENSDYTQATLEEGLNMNDWLVRSRQILTKNDGVGSADSLYTYVQHTFVDKKAMMQAGQINISNTLFAGTAINGIQWVPETALNERSSSGVTVHGIAQGPQARVEVRQAGSLVYSTLVPMGPFTLNNVPITSINTALNVTVKETDGSESRFIVPAEALHPNQLGGPQGLSMAAGQVRDANVEGNSPNLVTASDGWQLSPRLNVSAGAMAATQYRALAGTLDIAPLSNTIVSLGLKASDDQRGHNKGQALSLSMNYHTASNISLTAAASRYSVGYRELLDTLQDDFTPYSGQYSANIGWNNSTLGAFSLGYSLNQGVNGEDSSRYVSVSWSHAVMRANVSVSWQSQIGQSKDDADQTNGKQLFVNVSIPFGSQHVGAYMRKQSRSANAGLQTSGSLNHDIAYSIAAERDLGERENSFSGSLSDNLHSTQLSVSAGTNGPDSKNYGATLSGGVLAHSQGVTFSPYKIEDTFALVTLGDKVSNVEISTPSGDVWTDRWGRAVIPSLPAYRSALVEINTETLPKNIDINNGTSLVKSGHGAVSQLQFGVINVHRAMLTVSMADGQKLAKGTTIVDAEGNYVITSVEEGLVFLNDVDNLSQLYATDEAGQRLCQLHYTLPKARDMNAFYDQATGVCQ
jgi:outer membrane usher protein FimD/PapC